MKIFLCIAVLLAFAAAVVPLMAVETVVLRPLPVPVPPIPTAQVVRPGGDVLPANTGLPKPLVLPEGKRITTEADWKAHRNGVKQLLMSYATGFVPPAPGNVRGRVLNSRALLDGSVRSQLVHLSFGPNQELGFDVAVFTPDEPVDTDKLAAGKGDIFQCGYAVLTYHHQDTGEDTIARNPDGSWAFRNARFFPAYPGCDWGLLEAWAWGISRCAGYLVTQDFVDKAL